MLVPMTKVRILGRRGEVERVVERAPPARPRGDRRCARLRARRRAGRRGDPFGAPRAAPPPRRRRSRRCWRDGSADAGACGEPPTRRRWMPARCGPSWSASSPPVEALGRRLDALRDERLVLPGYLEPLRRLAAARARARRPRRRAAAPVCGWPPSRSSSTPTTSRSSRRSATSSRRSSAVASSWSGRASRTGRSAAWSCSARPSSGAVRAAARPRRRFASAALPEAFERLSLRAAVEAMERRLAELPAEPSPPSRRARGAAAPARRPPARSARCDRRTSSSGSTRSSDSARRSARSSPSAGCPGADLARLRRELAPGSAPPSSSRTWRRLRVTRRRRCSCATRGWHDRSSRSSASWSFRAPARSIRRC